LPKLQKLTLNMPNLHFWKCYIIFRAGGLAGRHINGEVRFGRDRGERQRYREIERHSNKETYLATKRHRDRADNKNPKQSRVAQLVTSSVFPKLFLLVDCKTLKKHLADHIIREIFSVDQKIKLCIEKWTNFMIHWL
jgi:hypothetical protein